MTIRNLDALFRPRSIALIGASRRDHSVGSVLARNLFRGGFQGPIMPVHPREAAIEGVLAYPSVAALPQVPDLAIIATPRDSVVPLVADLAARGCRAAVVITAGFGEGGDAAGAALSQQMLAAAKPKDHPTKGMRILGPNCLGLLVPGIGLNASFAHIPAKAGDIACISQSGALATSLLDWAAGRGIGFSHMVTLGNMADIDFGDMLNYLAADGGTSAVMLYVEGLTEARKFMSAARSLARMKPVIVIKSGRHAASATAAKSHTGALAGSDAVYDAAFRRAGMLRVDDLEEVFAALEAVARMPRLDGDRLAILTNGGGVGVLAADSVLDAGGRLATLAPETVAALDRVLPASWSRANPVDIIGDAPGDRYIAALGPVLHDPGVDALLVLNAPTAVASSLEAAQAVTGWLKDHPPPQGKALLTSWVGGEAAAEARTLFADAGIASYSTPSQAVRGFQYMARYRKVQDELMEAPRATAPCASDPAAARAIVRTALAAGREWLDEADAKAVLAAYGIPVVRTFAAADPQDAARLAAGLTPPLAVKIRSRDITHKSDVGGVILNLPDAAAVATAAGQMLDRVRTARPDAVVDGFTVQEMIRRPGAYELILGLSHDPTFGPVILFGHGGVGVEVIGDKALALPPLNHSLARDLIGRTRIARLLGGFRSRPPADLEAICAALMGLSHLAVDLPEVAELDINPLLADEAGVVALDARIRLQSADRARPLAVPPYPDALERDLILLDGQRLHLRPVRPEDADAFHALFARLDPNDIRMRFFAPIRTLSRPMMARLTQIDYDRAMACVATPPDALGDIWGVVRLTADPDLQRAEFGVLVRSDIKGRGLGYRLMQEIVAYGRSRGIGQLYGTILRENDRMLEIARDLGFSIAADPDDPSVVIARLAL